MDLTQIPQLKTALTLAGLRPNKSLGQHFLIDRPALEAVIGAISPTPMDTVLEIGPGLGVMTQELVTKVGKVVAVETDPVLAELLARDAAANLTVVKADILAYNLTELGDTYKVAANIPYYLTSKIIRLLLEGVNPPSVMSLLIQREVAKRIVAEPGSMSILALSIQYYAEADIVLDVPRDKFWLAPDVDSAVIRIVRRPKPAFDANAAELFRLIKAGFGEKRKQLKNSLAGGLKLSTDETIALLDAAGLAPTARAQELSLVEWERLYKAAKTAEYVE